jgi:hypothetical protein
MNTNIKINVLDQWKMFLCEGCQHTKNNPEMKKTNYPLFRQCFIHVNVVVK